MNREKNETKSRYGIVNFERRRHPRYSIDLPVEYWPVKPPIDHAGRADNISEGGLLIFLPEKIAVGQHLKLRLFFAPVSDLLHTMEALVEVVWVGMESLEASGQSGNYRCGLKFIEADGGDMEKLKDFLKGLTG